jgi:hypothetical protein
MIARGIIDSSKTVPDQRAQQYVIAAIIYQDTTANFTNIQGYSDQYFLDVGPTGQANEDVFGVNEIDGGTSSGSNSPSTLNDTSKSWPIDAHVNKVCIIRGGLAGAVGQIAKIASNTGTQLVIAAGWEFAVTPDATSTYEICDEGWRFISTATGRVCREGV